MRLPRNFGTLLVGALVGGILVAAALITVQLLLRGDQLDASKQSIGGADRVEQSGTDDQNGMEAAVGIEDFTKLLSTTRDFEGTNALYQALVRIDQAELTELLERSKKISSPNHRLFVQEQYSSGLRPSIRRKHLVMWRTSIGNIKMRFWYVSSLNGPFPIWTQRSLPLAI